MKLSDGEVFKQDDNARTIIVLFIDFAIKQFFIIVIYSPFYDKVKQYISEKGRALDGAILL